MNELTTITNIRRLVQSLNDELRAAHELGLKATASGSSMYTFAAGLSERVSVRVWKETPLLQEPELERDLPQNESK